MVYLPQLFFFSLFFLYNFKVIKTLRNITDCYPLNILHTVEGRMADSGQIFPFLFTGCLSGWQKYYRSGNRTRALSVKTPWEVQTRTAHLSSPVKHLQFWRIRPGVLNCHQDNGLRQIKPIERSNYLRPRKGEGCDFRGIHKDFKLF